MKAARAGRPRRRRRQLEDGSRARRRGRRAARGGPRPDHLAPAGRLGRRDGRAWWSSRERRGGRPGFRLPGRSHPSRCSPRRRRLPRRTSGSCPSSPRCAQGWPPPPRRVERHLRRAPGRDPPALGRGADLRSGDQRGRGCAEWPLGPVRRRRRYSGDWGGGGGIGEAAWRRPFGAGTGAGPTPRWSGSYRPTSASRHHQR